MARKQTTKPAPAPEYKPLTMAQAAEYARHDLTRMYEAAQVAAQELRARAPKYEDNPVNEMLYRLRWAESDTVVAARGVWANEVLVAAEIAAETEGGTPDENLYGALCHWRASLRERMLRDEWRGASTDHFHNAVEHATRAATSAFLRETDRLERMMAEARAMVV